MEWIHTRHADSFDQMTNLPKSLRAELSAHADICRGTIIHEAVANDATRKLLIEWPDNQRVETVWIPEARRHTACVSSQVGCPVGCRFCASGLDGLQRNLTTGEIVEQARHVQRRITELHGPGPDRLTHIVFMGMGEPLANYNPVINAIRILNADWGPNIGARRITLSTVGLPQQIRRLAREGLQLNLALSLHAATQELREELIPWGQVPLEDLVDACADYFEQTGREITLEYVLLSGVNMGTPDARGLATICRRIRCNVNLLRYNPVPGLPFRRPNAEETYDFQRDLRERGVNAHVRTSRGRDVDAACGQLRRRAGFSPPTA